MSAVLDLDQVACSGNDVVSVLSAFTHTHTPAGVCAQNGGLGAGLKSSTQTGMRGAEMFGGSFAVGCSSTEAFFFFFLADGLTGGQVCV